MATMKKGFQLKKIVYFSLRGIYFVTKRERYIQSIQGSHWKIPNKKLKDFGDDQDLKAQDY